jgi:hypothetical protein
MPRTKKLTKIDKSAIRISSDRKSTRRMSTRRKEKSVFLQRVIDGMKKFLSSPFK